MARSISAENLSPNDKVMLTALLAELTAIRTAYALLAAKLDADAGVTDTDYAAACAIAAATVTR